MTSKKKQNKSDSSPKSLNSNAAFIIKETHPDRVNKCDQILKSRIFFWRLFLRDDIKLYTRYLNQLKCRQR